MVEAGRAVNDLMAQICAERFVGSSEYATNQKVLDEMSGKWEKATYIRNGTWGVSPNGDKPDIDTAERCNDLIAKHAPEVPEESS